MHYSRNGNGFIRLRRIGRFSNHSRHSHHETLGIKDEIQYSSPAAEATGDSLEPIVAEHLVPIADRWFDPEADYLAEIEGVE